MLRSAQIRAARALLGIGQRELSTIADVALSTVKRIEVAEELTGSAQTLWKIQTALEKEGIMFIPVDQAGGPGVRLREVPSSKAKRKRSR